MSRKRKRNSRAPQAVKLDELRRQARRATLAAQAEPTHENLTRAFALQSTVKVVEAQLGKTQE